MATAAHWALGYARQAGADFQAWQSMERNDDVHRCHRLLLLQMACEKLCKAHLIQAGTMPEVVQTSHGYIANPLPVVIRQQLVHRGENLAHWKGFMHFTRHLASEIEVMNPAIDRNGQRPDNCEYPWEDAVAVLHSPLDWGFPTIQLLEAKHGRTFVKLLHGAIQRVVEELS